MRHSSFAPTFPKARTDPGVDRSVDAAHVGVCATTGRRADPMDRQLSDTGFVYADGAAQGATFLAGFRGRFGCGGLLARGKGFIAPVQASLEALCLIGGRRFVST